MFSRIHSYISNTYKSMTDRSPSKNTDASAPAHPSTWVYIWNTTSQGPGHAAIQVGGDKPKLTDDQQGDYVSIHPKAIPSVGPTIILPVPATLATSLQSDMTAEATSNHHFDTNDDISIQSLANESNTSQLPSQTFKLENLDTNAMSTYIQATRHSVDTGETTYQLLPHVDTLGFIFNTLQNSATYVNQDPIDIELSEKSHIPPEAQPAINRYNCATLVSDILNAGGMHITQSKMPWGITPSDLANKINQENENAFQMKQS